MEKVEKRLLSEKDSQTQNLIFQKQILSFQEAVQYLDLSKSLLYKLTSSRGITFTKPNNGKLFFKKKDLDNYMMQNEVKSLTVLEGEVNEYLKQN